jgi:hypothetical protein
MVNTPDYGPTFGLRAEGSDGFLSDGDGMVHSLIRISADIPGVLENGSQRSSPLVPYLQFYIFPAVAVH